MSLRRRPIETATYIPAANNAAAGGGGGFSLTSSGAIGFSDEIERKLSPHTTTLQSTSTRASGALSSTPAAKSAITCNRDALSRIKPFSSSYSTTAGSYFPTDTAAYEDDGGEETMMHMGIPISNEDIINQRMISSTAKYAKRDNTFKQETKYVHQDIQFKILDFMTCVRNDGRYRTCKEALDASKHMIEKTHKPIVVCNIFREYNAKHRKAMHGASNHINMMERPEWMDAYMGLRDTCASIERQWVVGPFTYEALKDGEKLFGEKPVFTPQTTNKIQKFRQMKHCIKLFENAEKFCKKLDELEATMLTAPLPKTTSASTADQWKLAHEMLNQRTTDLQERLMMQHSMQDEEQEKGLYCTCEEPEPVSLHDSEHMYCTCENPVPFMIDTSTRADNQLQKLQNDIKRRLAVHNKKAGDRHAHADGGHQRYKHPGVGTLRMYIDSHEKNHHSGGHHRHHAKGNRTRSAFEDSGMSSSEYHAIQSSF